jgi:hypothetical protein
MKDRPGRQRTLVPATGTLPASELYELIGASVATPRAHETFRPAAGSQVSLASLLLDEFRLKSRKFFGNGGLAMLWFAIITSAPGIMLQGVNSNDVSLVQVAES